MSEEKLSSFTQYAAVLFCILLCFIGCNLAYNVTQRTEIRKIYTFYLLTFFTYFSAKKERERREGNVIFYTHVLTMGILTHWLLQMSCYTMVQNKSKNHNIYVYNEYFTLSPFIIFCRVLLFDIQQANYT